MFFDNLPTEIVSIIILYLNINQIGYILSCSNKKYNKIVNEHSIWSYLIDDFNLSYLIYKNCYGKSSTLINLDNFVNELSWIRNLTLKNSGSYISKITFSSNSLSVFKNKCYLGLINLWTQECSSNTETLQSNKRINI